jgi:hypothetical protein
MTSPKIKVTPILPSLHLHLHLNLHLYLQVSEHGTAGCSASGYLIQYFFLAFFFWLNSLAWHIYLPFSSLGLAARIHRVTD